MFNVPISTVLIIILLLFRDLKVLKEGVAIREKLALL